ncbi:MAG: rhodanese-like domain-containing protein [Flavobacteriaceae bacterium]|jgi:rhodanese-related sulfurtransferase|nr:rhodanese-like domain-containing protein [Formosa sp.]MDG1375260.1 rhodanese-like domain-containing protein [Flavobacteriaceae bacterium]MDG2499245.1 rhodanese-like domain-containing protein [Flavobacteriaceae bacterium]
MRFLKFGCALLGLLTLFNCKKNQSEAIELITPAEMKEISEIEGIQLVDVRTPAEYKEGHLPNALNIDFFDPNFEVNIQKLDKTKPVIVYCQRGSRSAKCASQLIANGFVKIYDLDRGFSKWKSSGFEVEN